MTTSYIKDKTDQLRWDAYCHFRKFAERPHFSDRPIAVADPLVNGLYSVAVTGFEQTLDSVNHLLSPFEKLAFTVVHLGGRIINLLGQVFGFEWAKTCTFQRAWKNLTLGLETIIPGLIRVAMNVPATVVLIAIRFFKPSYSISSEPKTTIYMEMGTDSEGRLIYMEGSFPASFLESVRKFITDSGYEQKNGSETFTLPAEETVHGHMIFTPSPHSKKTPSTPATAGAK